MSQTPIAFTAFADGPMRPVYETHDCRQYVIDDDAKRVFGIWYVPREESKPVIVEPTDPDF